MQKIVQQFLLALCLFLWVRVFLITQERYQILNQGSEIQELHQKDTIDTNKAPNDDPVLPADQLDPSDDEPIKKLMELLRSDGDAVEDESLGTEDDSWEPEIEMGEKESDLEVIGSDPEPEPEGNEEQESLPEKIDEVIPPEQEKAIPLSYVNQIPFFAQAPEWDRNQPRQDACEEASIILAAYGLKGKSLSRAELISDIRDLVNIQNELFGSWRDTTIAQTKQLYDLYYGIWTATIIDNPNVEQMKQLLSEGKLIVAPFAGKMLGNIYYSNWWPRYHMLTIVGYDENWFITHDVGTKRGEGYRYSDAVLMNALHDFVSIAAWSIQNGAKRVLVLER